MGGRKKKRRKREEGGGERDVYMVGTHKVSSFSNRKWARKVKCLALMKGSKHTCGSSQPSNKTINLLSSRVGWVAFREEEWVGNL